MFKKLLTLIILLIIFSGWSRVQGAGFRISPAKIEIVLQPGEAISKSITIKNETAETITFETSVKDVEGSSTGDQPSRIIEEGKGLYSLKDFLKPEIEQFTLLAGESKTLLVDVSLPESMIPGGHYAVALFSNTAPAVLDQGDSPVVIETRAGTLFFVRVEGDIEEAGQLEKFQIASRRFYQTTPVSFSILYGNKGNVHLNPYGVIELRDIFGRKKDEIIIDPYFALPSSLRERKIQWSGLQGPGRYTATLVLNRGYGDNVDTARVSFWVMPWWTLLIAGVLLVLMIVAIGWFLEQRRNQKIVDRK